VIVVRFRDVRRDLGNLISHLGETTRTETGNGHREAGVVVPHAVATGHRHGGSETILVVEDDGALRALTRRIVEEEGYAVLDVLDAAEPSGVPSLPASRPPTGATTK
jgi:hypothetical protein